MNLESLTSILFKAKALKQFFNKKTWNLARAPKNTKWLLLVFKIQMDTIKDDRSIKWNSSSKVDLKGLYLNQFIKKAHKNNIQSGTLKNSMGPY